MHIHGEREVGDRMATSAAQGHEMTNAVDDRDEVCAAMNGAMTLLGRSIDAHPSEKEKDFFAKAAISAVAN